MTDKVLVIGGCGFIGSHVVDSLVRDGVSVRVLDRKPEAFRPELTGVEYVLGDFSDVLFLLEALEGIDAVAHCASVTVPSTSNIDPVGDIKGNLISTVRLLELLRRQNIKKLMYLSSGGTIYGVPHADPVPEDHPQNPISSYGIVKAAIEKYIFMEQKLHALEPVVLRASNPYGPRQGHTGVQGVISTYLWKFKRGERLEVWGDGSVVRDFIHVKDLADLCVTALSSDQTGCYNAGSGVGCSVNDIIAAVRNVTGEELEPLYRAARAYDVPRIVLDITRARQSFQWQPQKSLTDGISDTWEWIRTQ